MVLRGPKTWCGRARMGAHAVSSHAPPSPAHHQHASDSRLVPAGRREPRAASRACGALGRPSPRPRWAESDIALTLDTDCPIFTTTSPPTGPVPRPFGPLLALCTSFLAIAAYGLLTVLSPLPPPVHQPGQYLREIAPCERSPASGLESGPSLGHRAGPWLPHPQAAQVPALPWVPLSGLLVLRHGLREREPWLPHRFRTNYVPSTRASPSAPRLCGTPRLAACLAHRCCSILGRALATATSLSVQALHPFAQHLRQPLRTAWTDAPSPVLRTPHGGKPPCTPDLLRTHIHTRTHAFSLSPPISKT